MKNQIIQPPIQRFVNVVNAIRYIRRTTMISKSVGELTKLALLKPYIINAPLD